MGLTRSCWGRTHTPPSAEVATKGIPSSNIFSVLSTERSFGPLLSKGGLVLTTRGGDFELDIGQDLSIGYLSHSATTVELYFQESFTFRLLTTEAAVALTPQKK